MRRNKGFTPRRVLVAAVVDIWYLYLVVFEVEGLVDVEVLVFEVIGFDLVVGHVQ